MAKKKKSTKRTAWAKHIDRSMSAKKCGTHVKVTKTKSGKRKSTQYTENRVNRCD